MELVRSKLGKLAITVLATLALVVPASAASAIGSDVPTAPSPAKVVKAVPDVGINAIFIVEGYDNINFSGRRIIDLHGPTGCTASVSDRDYAVRDLGYNNNQLSSMRVRNSGCVILLFDGPDFTGTNWVQFQDCPNLGSCDGHNIWKRANSFIVT
jgi:hypothetical protein